MVYKPLINIKNLSISYLDKTLFESLSFSVGRGEIVALIGANGCGKTTLLNFINAKITGGEEFLGRHELLIKGDMVTTKNLSLSYLPQRLRENTFNQNDPAPAGRSEQVHELFSLDNTDNDKNKLSDGQRQKRAIVRVMTANSDLLLFDEPTNYLDIAGITAFEDTLSLLKSRGRGMLLVSHDRTLINNVADKTVYLTPNGVYRTEGGFSAAWSLAGTDFDSKQKEAQTIRNKIANLQTEMRTRMNWSAQKEKSKKGAGGEKPYIAKMASKMAARAKSARRKADKEIEKLESTRPYIPKKVKFNFPTYRVRNRDVFTLQNTFFDYTLIGTDGEQIKDFPILLESIDLTVSTQGKVCLMGANGAGKSTLFKIILGEIRPQKGQRIYNKNIPVRYLPQGLTGFFPKKRLLDNFRDTGCSETSVRNHLGSVLLRGDKVNEPVSNFSQGELMRAGIVKCILQQAEFLLLDEPTSHLDIESVQVLEKMLEAFPGGYMIISHDRTFVENVAERLYLLEGGRLKLV